MKNEIKSEILKLKNNLHVDQKILFQHLQFLEKEKFFTRPENPRHHFGIYFLPVHKSSRSIFLVNHKKADSWIPPGEHLEKGETPVEAVIRGIQEELQYKPHINDVKLFNLSIT